MASVLLASDDSHADAASEPAAAYAWPARVVAIEDLQPLERFRLIAPGLVVKGRVTGPTSLRVHVNQAGEVSRIAMLASCGNADLDEAALHAMRSMRFEPYRFDGAPTDVTLVVPVHVPKGWGRTD